MATIARTPAEVIAAEAVSGTPEERYADMKAIASVIANRAAMLGISPEDVIANTNEFNSYNTAMPPGTAALVGMAQQAIDDVSVNGVVNKATFYSTPTAQENLPGGLAMVDSTAGHNFFSDPANRAINTALGYKTPNPENLPGVETAFAAPIPSARPTPSLNNFSDLAANPTPSYPDLSQTGLLGSVFSSNPTPASPVSATASGLLGATPDLSASAVASPLAGVKTPTVSGWNDMAVAGPMVAGAPFSEQAPPSGISEVGTGAGTPTDVGTRMGLPERNDFSTMATYGPVASPLGVTASVDPMATPDLSAQASVPGGILSGVPASRPALNSFGPLAAATPVSSPMAVTASAPTTATTPGLAANAGLGISVSPADNFAARFGPSFDPYSNPQSYLDTPTPGLLSGYQETPTATPAEDAISSAISPPTAVAASVSPYRDTPVPSPTDLAFGGITPSQLAQTPMVNQAISPSVPDLDVGNFNLGVQSPGYQSVVNASFPAAPPSIPSIEAATNVPSIAAPTSTRVSSPQSISPSVGIGATSAKPQRQGFLNGGTLVGGILGGLVAGPVGGILGGLVGNKINQGGLTGLLGGPAMPSSINNIGGGLASVASVYGGAPPGTQATTNNGGTVTSLGRGYTAYKNPMGVTTVQTPSGVPTSVFGSPGFGGLLGGLFGGSGGQQPGAPGGGGYSPGSPAGAPSGGPGIGGAAY